MHRCPESAIGTTSLAARCCGTSISGVLTRSVWCRAGSASTSIASGTSCPETPRGSMKIRGSTMLPCTHGRMRCTMPSSSLEHSARTPPTTRRCSPRAARSTCRCLPSVPRSFSARVWPMRCGSPPATSRAASCPTPGTGSWRRIHRPPSSWLQISSPSHEGQRRAPRRSVTRVSLCGTTPPKPCDESARYDDRDAKSNVKPDDEETTAMKDQNYAATKTYEIRLARRSPEYWRVTFDHPPLNIFGPEMLPQVNEIITAIETDEQVKVVVFDSAVEGFFLIHLDFLAKLDVLAHLPPGSTGLHPWPEMLVRLSRASVVSMALIRGRATGMGSELALACDMRFASREKAILSQFEVGAGLVPGGGPMARLSRLMGRGRALEVILSANDVSGDLAERYGYVNRSLPDADLDRFVDALATRIASFNKQTIMDTKRLVNIASLPPDIEIESGWNACVASMGRPATQQRIKTLLERGFCKPGDAENRLGDFVGQS